MQRPWDGVGEHGTGGKLKAKDQWKDGVIEEEECDVPWSREGR